MRENADQNNSEYGHFYAERALYMFACFKTTIIKQHHKHLLTSNLKIKGDSKKFFPAKGPKYEENKMISFGKAKLDIIAVLNESIET